MTVHNRCDTTKLCLCHLFKNLLTDVDIKVYLVDDGCTDGTAEVINREYPSVHIIEGNGDLYWNRGMHKAWTEADKEDPDFFLWLNDDTMLFSHALSTMIDAYNQANEDFCIISGATRATNTETVTYGGRINKKVVSPNGRLQRIELINGNCLLVPKCVRQKIGILDDYFHHSMGDWEYGLRAAKNNISLYLAPQFIGVCDLHEIKLPKCYDSSYSIKERFQYLKNPLAPMPNEVFYFCNKCYGLKRAIQSSLKIIVRTIFPQLF